MQRVGLIAGNGRFPLIFARTARAAGVEVVAVAHTGETLPALSLRQATGKPILFLGVGEKLDALEAFDPARVAGRILGMGDVVGLVERARAAVEDADALRLAERALRSEFTLEDFLDQLPQVKKMGSIEEIVAMLPGMSREMRGQLAPDDPVFAAQLFLHMVISLPQRRAAVPGTPMTPDELGVWARNVVNLFLNGCRSWRPKA